MNTDSKIVASGGIQIPASAGAGLVAVSDASGNISWQQVPTGKLSTQAVGGDYNGIYRPWIPSRAGSIASAAAAAIYLPTGDGVVPSGSTGAGRAVFYFDPAWITLSGLTAKLIVRLAITTNNTAPGITFTAGLYPVTASAGSAEPTLTLGTVITGSTAAIATPAATSRNQNNSGDFNASLATAGYYVLGCSTSGANATGSVPDLAMALMFRHQ